MTDPLKCGLARQLGVSPSSRVSCMVLPQPQGQLSAADLGIGGSPIT